MIPKYSVQFFNKLGIFLLYVGVMLHAALVYQMYMYTPDAFVLTAITITKLYFIRNTLLVFGLFFIGLGTGIYGVVYFIYRQQLDVHLKEPFKIFEIKLPPFVDEGAGMDGAYTYSAMEGLFESIHAINGEPNKYRMWYKGSRRVTYSFEIVGHAGEVFFYVRVPAKVADTMTTSIYAYFPNAQITEVNDYTLERPYTETTHQAFAFEYKLKNPDWQPIKTYKDLELDTRKKILQGEGVDPIAPLFELAGSMLPTESFWIQFIMRGERWPHAHVHDLQHKALGFYQAGRTSILNAVHWHKTKLADDIKAEIPKMLTEKKVKESEENVLPEFDTKKLLEYQQRALSKQTYDVQIRCAYIAKKGEARNSHIVSQMRTVFRLTNAQLNSIEPEGRVFEDTDMTGDDNEYGKAEECNTLLELYRARLFDFYPAMYRIAVRYTYDYVFTKPMLQRITRMQNQTPWKHRPSMRLTTEALATICHFPSPLTKTPTVRRAAVRTAEPPVNLPSTVQ